MDWGAGARAVNRMGCTDNRQASEWKVEPAMRGMCMLSAVQGVVTEHGKPVPGGAVIKRSFFWH